MTRASHPRPWENERGHPARGPRPYLGPEVAAAALGVVQPVIPTAHQRLRAAWDNFRTVLGCTILPSSRRQAVIAGCDALKREEAREAEFWRRPLVPPTPLHRVAGHRHPPPGGLPGVSYQPRTPRGEWYRQAILAVLRQPMASLDQAMGGLQVGRIAERIGFMVIPPNPRWPQDPAWCDVCRARHAGPTKRRIGSQDLQPTMVTMLRHGELERSRSDSSAIYRWRLGPCAPAPVDLGDLVDPFSVEA